MRTAGLRLDQAPRLDIPLRFFLTAPLFGAAAGVLLAVGGADLLRSPWHPHTIALVHLLTLGTLTMTMLGALYQILPVVVGIDVPGIRLGPWLHGAFVAGVLLLVAGLLGTGRPWGPPALWGALPLLGGSLLTLLSMLSWCLLRHAGPGGTVPLLRLALLALWGTVALGLVFLAGHGLGWWPLPRAAALPIHAFWSLGGWVGGLIAGVGMAVLPMFYIAPPFSRRAVLAIVLALGAMLATVSLVFTAHAALGPLPVGWLLLPLGCGVGALAIFTGGLVRMQRARRRKVSDTSLRYWQGALAAAWLAMPLAAAAIVLPHPRWALAFGGVYLVGFAGSVLGGMLFKIVPFLLWMHRFSRLAGTGSVPMMSDLLPRRRTQRQLAAHFAAVVALAAATLWPWGPLVRLAGVLLAASQGWLWFSLLAAVRYRSPPAPGAGAGAGGSPGAGAASPPATTGF